jgi:DNA-binding response OmpR family regulator
MGERILIVEDDEILREIYYTKFSMEGFEVSSAADGQEGLAEVEKHQPDLVLLDMLMPKVSGLEFLRIFQSSPNSANAKVLVASNKSSDDMVAEAMALGACDYLIKSKLTPDEIVARAREHLVAE